MFRGDYALTRHLAETFSPATARAWQGLPYLLLPGAGFTEYVIKHNGILAASVTHLDALPWSEFLCDFPVGLSPLLEYSVREAANLLFGAEEIDVASPTLQAAGRPHTIRQARATVGSLSAERKAELMTPPPTRGRCLIRVTEGLRYLRTWREMSPWLTGPVDLLAPFRTRSDRYIALEVWEERTTRPEGTLGYPAYPDVSLIPADQPWNRPRWAHLYPNLRCRTGRVYGDGTGFCTTERCPYLADAWRSGPCLDSSLVMGMGVILTLCTIAYLLRMDEYLVYVEPRLTERQRRQHAKHSTGDKPWTRLDLPHYILIDPQRVSEYGQPSREPQGGSHAAPIPHSRRGHWRELRAERYERDEAGKPRKVWVTPAWIGEMEWTSGGAHYQVMPPRL